MKWKIRPEFPAAVRERLAIVESNAQQNITAINQRIGAEKTQEWKTRLNALIRSREPVWVRLRGLYALADEMATYNQANVACSRGCSHCCHMAVGVLQPEALMLGAALKRHPKPVADTDLSNFDFGYHNPCTFLEGRECTIYEHRPLACRIYYSLDKDALLCQLIRPHTPSVPGLNTAEMFQAYHLICGPSKKADIRQYFPRSNKAQRQALDAVATEANQIPRPAAADPSLRNATSTSNVS